MKNTYYNPQVTVLYIDTQDVIATSTGMGTQNDDIGYIGGDQQA